MYEYRLHIKMLTIVCFQVLKDSKMYKTYNKKLLKVDSLFRLFKNYLYTYYILE